MMNIASAAAAVLSLVACLSMANLAAQTKNPEDAAVRKAIENHYFKA